MPATATPATAPPPLPRRRRVYATVDPRYEWARTEREDTLVVDVSGFRKEELRVLYSTNRKLKVTGERQADGGQWARFAKVFPVPKSCDSGAIRARMNIDTARLSVVLPKRLLPSSSSTDKQNEPHSMGEHKGQGSAGGSSGSSSDSLYSAQEDAGTDKVEEEEQRKEQRPEAMAVQDSLKRNDGDANTGRRHHDDANAAGRDHDVTNAAGRGDGDDKDESKKWWRKIRVVHVLGFVLILALVGVGATLLYVMLL